MQPTRSDRGHPRERVTQRHVCLRGMQARGNRSWIECLAGIQECVFAPVPEQHNQPRIFGLAGRNDRNQAIFAFYYFSRLTALALHRAACSLDPFTEVEQQNGVASRWRDFVVNYVNDCCALQDRLREMEARDGVLELPSAEVARLLRQARDPFNRLSRLVVEEESFLEEYHHARDAYRIDQQQRSYAVLLENWRRQMLATMELLSAFFDTGEEPPPADEPEDGIRDGEDAHDGDGATMRLVRKLQIFLCNAVEYHTRCLPNVNTVFGCRARVATLVGDCCIERCLRVRGDRQFREVGP